MARLLLLTLCLPLHTSIENFYHYHCTLSYPSHLKTGLRDSPGITTLGLVTFIGGLRFQVADHIVLSIQDSCQSPHIILLRLMVRVHESPAFVMSRVVTLHGIPFSILPVVLFMVLPFPRTVGYQGAMVPKKLGARGSVVTWRLPAVIRPGVIIRYIRH